jgi:transposase
VLEGANIKLSAVVSDLLGKSGRAMLEALVAGASESRALACLARGRLRAKIPHLEPAPHGHCGAHQRFLIAEQLAHIDAVEARIERVSAEIAERMRPHEEALQRLQTIPGIGRRTAQVLVAEIGPDLSRFKSAHHLASWAGWCPGHNESAGKRRSARTRKGSPWLRSALVEAARAAGRGRKQDTYRAAQYRRLAARRGSQRAAGRWHIAFSS